MSILDKKPKPAKPTKEQKKVRIADRIGQQARRLLEHVTKAHKELIATVYQNDRGLTPQEVYDGLGEDAAEVVTFRRGLQEFVNTASGETVIDTSALPELILNQDGTVIVVV